MLTINKVHNYEFFTYMCNMYLKFFLINVKFSAFLNSHCAESKRAKIAANSISKIMNFGIIYKRSYLNCSDNI